VEISRGRAELGPLSAATGGEAFAGMFRPLAEWLIDIVAVTVLIFVGVSAVGEAVGPTVRFHPEAATLPDTVAVDMGKGWS
jgi:hypothetical protein